MRGMYSNKVKKGKHCITYTLQLHSTKLNLDCSSTVRRMFQSSVVKTLLFIYLFIYCKGTHFLIFLLKMLKDCDNLISLGTRSHIFGPRNETDSVPCLTEFTLRLCNVSFRRKLYRRETGTNISFKMSGENPCKTL